MEYKVLEESTTPEGVEVQFVGVDDCHDYIIWAFPVAKKDSEDGSIKKGSTFKVSIKPSPCPYNRFRNLKEGKTTLEKCSRYFLNKEDKLYL